MDQPFACAADAGAGQPRRHGGCGAEAKARLSGALARRMGGKCALLPLQQRDSRNQSRSQLKMESAEA